MQGLLQVGSENVSMNGDHSALDQAKTIVGQHQSNPITINEDSMDKEYSYKPTPDDIGGAIKIQANRNLKRETLVTADNIEPIDL